MLRRGFSRRPLIIWLVLFLPFGAQHIGAQEEGILAGRVTDAESGEPIADVAVEVVGGPGSGASPVFSDAGGRFRLGLPPGTYALVLSMLGHETRRIDGIEVLAGETTEVEASLTTRAFALNPLVITASRREEKALEAPAAVSIVGAERIRTRTAFTPVEHLEGLKGVDLARTGLTQSNVVTRGFNNVFSGSLLVLTDNRYARVPSLRFNAYNMIPTTNFDVDRIEVVLGPGAALYGPNSASGVMHLITTSPIDDPGTKASFASGIRAKNDVEKERDLGAGGIFQGEFRHAERISDAFGIKVSAQWLRGDDWTFVDPAEVEAGQQAGASPRIGDRRDRAERWGGEIRLDWRPWDDGEVIVNGGVNQLEKSVELTGLGAGQALDWRYSYVQSRIRKGRLFLQGFVNMSDAGDTFLLRTGDAIIDESQMWVGQLQHGFDLGDRQSFIYGVDVLHTVPRTGGTITGSNEGDDAINEVGGYLHSETSLHERLDLVAALRIDSHDRLPDLDVSPRAALVFRPAPEQNLRFTFNRAFSTPTTNNLFLDIRAGRVPIPPGDPLFGYDIRTVGVPETGFTFEEPCQGGFRNLCMASPLQPGQRLPADAALFWNGLVQGLVPPQLRPLLTDPGSRPGDPQLGSVLRRFNQVAAQEAEGQVFPLDPAGPREIERLTSTITNTLELGYKGLVAGRVLLSGDVYRSSIRDFVGPLRVETPNVFLDPASTRAFVLARLQPLLEAGAVSPDQVQSLVEGLAGVPVGTVVPDQRNTSDIVLTYRNFGDIDFWGLDLGAEVLATDRLSFRGTFSWVSEECFDFNEDGDCSSAVDIALNAPKRKGSVGARYQHRRAGLTVEGRARFTDGFIMNSGVYVGDVDSYAVFDASVTYDLSVLPGASATLSVNNVFNDLHQEFVGAPELGRVGMLRVAYDF